MIGSPSVIHSFFRRCHIACVDPGSPSASPCPRTPRLRMIFSSHGGAGCIIIGVFYLKATPRTTVWFSQFLSWYHDHQYEIGSPAALAVQRGNCCCEPHVGDIAQFSLHIRRQHFTLMACLPTPTNCWSTRGRERISLLRRLAFRKKHFDLERRGSSFPVDLLQVSVMMPHALALNRHSRCEGITHVLLDGLGHELLLR